MYEFQMEKLIKKKKKGNNSHDNARRSKTKILIIKFFVIRIYLKNTCI